MHRLQVIGKLVLAGKTIPILASREGTPEGPSSALVVLAGMAEHIVFAGEALIAEGARDTMLNWQRRIDLLISVM